MNRYQGTDWADKSYLRDQQVCRPLAWITVCLLTVLAVATAVWA